MEYKDKEIINNNLKKIKNYFDANQNFFFNDVQKIHDLIDQKFTFDNLLLCSWFLKYMLSIENFKFDYNSFTNDEFVFNLIINFFIEKLTNYQIKKENKNLFVKIKSIKNLSNFKIFCQENKININENNFKKSFLDIISEIKQGSYILENSLIIIWKNSKYEIQQKDIYMLFFDENYSHIYAIYFIYEYFKCIFSHINCAEIFSKLQVDEIKDKEFSFYKNKVCESIIEKHKNLNVKVYGDNSNDNLRKIINKPFAFLKNLNKLSLNLNENLYFYENLDKIDKFEKNVAYNKPNSNDTKKTNSYFNFYSFKNILVEIENQIKNNFYKKSYDDKKHFNDYANINPLKKGNEIFKKIKKVSFNYVSENFNPDKVEILKKITKDIDNQNKRKSENQKKFRDNLMILYNSECVLTGINLDVALIASHIVAWNKLKNNDPKIIYSINNGLILVSSVDKLFDDYIISFDEKGFLYIPDYNKSNFGFEKKDIVDFLRKSGVNDDYLNNNKSIFEIISEKIKNFFNNEVVSYTGCSSGINDLPDLEEVKRNLKMHFLQTKKFFLNKINN